MPEWSSLNIWGSQDPTPPGTSSMEDFESWLGTQFAQLPQSLGVQQTTQRFPNFVRTVTQLRADSPLRSSMEGVADQPLIVDLQPGPSVSFGGESYQTAAPYARSGYGGVFGPENIVRSLEDQEIRDPNVAFREYFKIAFAPELLESWRTPQQNWGRALSLGYEGKSGMVVGGISQLARPVTDPETQDWVASQLRVGISGDVKDRSAAWRSIQGHIQSAAQIPFEQRTPGERVWGSMIGKVPYSQDLPGGGKSMALVNAGLVQGAGASGNIDYSVYGYGATAAERLKRLSIIGATPGVPSGHREQAAFLEQKGSSLVGMDPQYITGQGATPWERQAGYRYSNIGSGAQRSAAIVAPGAFAMKATPAEGSNIVYRNPLPKAVTAVRPGGHREYQIPYENVLDVARYKFDWGIMKERRAEGGGVTYEKQRPLTGATIEAGTSAIIGTYTQGETTTPLRMASPGRPTSITGEPTAFLPPGFQKSTGAGHPGVGIDISGKKALPTDYMPTNKYSEGFQQAFGVKDIRYESRGGIEVHIPTATHTWISGKGEGGGKATYTPVQEPIIGTTPRPYSPDVSLGRGQFPVSMLEQAPKNPLVRFQAGLEYSPVETIQSAMGLIPGKTGRALQEYVEPHHERYSSTGDRPRQIQREELGRIYAEGKGQEYVRGASYMGLMEDLYGKVTSMPQKQAAEQFGFAFTGRPQELPLGAMPEEMGQYLEQQAMHGARTAAQTNLSPSEAKKISSQVFRRQPVGEGGYEGVEEASVRGAGLYSTHVARPVPEYMSKQPITGYEEALSISAIDPKLAEEMGVGVDQGPGATGLMPEHVRAWRQIGDIFRYRWERESTGRMLGKEVRPTPTPVTEISQEKAAKLLTELEDMGESPDFKRIAQLTGGVGPYKHWKTGELFPHATSVGATTKYKFEGTEFEEPLNRSSRLFVPALKDFLKGMYFEPMTDQEAAEFDPSGAKDVPVQSRKMAALQAEYRQIFELSRGGTLLKELSGQFSPQSVAGRFGQSFGGLYDVLMQPGQMNTVFKQMANLSDTKTARRQESLMREQWAEHAKLPGMFGGQPIVQREGGVRPVNLVSPEYFERQGIHVAKGSTIREGNIAKGNVLSTGVVGQVSPAIAAVMMRDFDADQGSVYAAITKDPVMGYMASQNPALAQVLAAPTLDKLKSIDTQMIKATGSEFGVPGGKFNIMSEAFKDIIGTRPGQPGYKEMKGKAGAGAVPVGDLFEEGLRRIATPGAMGSAYNLRRMIEASGAALGFGEMSTTMMHGGMTQSYQEPLDYLRSSLSNLETIANTSLFTTNQAEQAKLIMKSGQEGGWETMWRQGETGGKYNYEMARFTSGRIEKDTAYQPEATAYMYAQRPGDVPGLAKRIGEQGLQEALIGKGGYIYQEGYQFGRSPLGNALETLATGRTFGWRDKPPKEVKLAGGRTEQVATTAARQAFPFEGGTIAIGKMGDEARYQLTMSTYESLTREKLQTPFASTMMNKALEQTPGGRKEGPPALRYWFSQYEGHRDVQALQLTGGAGWEPPKDMRERGAIGQEARAGQTHIGTTGQKWLMGKAQFATVEQPGDIQLSQFQKEAIIGQGGYSVSQIQGQIYGAMQSGMEDPNFAGVNLALTGGGALTTPVYSDQLRLEAGTQAAPSTSQPRQQVPLSTQDRRRVAQASGQGGGQQPPPGGGMPPFIPMGGGGGSSDDWFKRLVGGISSGVTAGNQALLEGTINAQLDVLHFGQGRTVTADWQQFNRGMSQWGVMQDWWRGGGAGFTKDIASKIQASVGLTEKEMGMFMEGGDLGVVGAKMAAWMDVDQEGFLKAYGEWERGGKEGRPIGGMSLMAQTRKATYAGAQAVKRGKLRETELGQTFPMAGQLQYMQEFESASGAGREQGLAALIGESMQEGAKALGVTGAKGKRILGGDDRGDIIQAAQKLTNSFTKLNEQVDKGTISHKEELAERQRLTIEETRLQKRMAGSLLTQQAQRISAATPEQLREGKFEEQMGAYMGLSRQYRTLERQETALTQPPTTATRTSQALRKMIGGWGLFYMGHLARMGLAPMQAGYQEYQEYAQTGDQMAQAAYGPGVVDPYAGPEAYRQRGLIRAGGGAWAAIQRAGARGMGTPLQDLSAGFLGGIGAYGLTMHTAGAMGGAGLEAGAATLSGAAPMVGLAVGGAMLLGQQMAYAQDPRGSTIQAAATLAGGGMFAKPSAGFRTQAADISALFADAGQVPEGPQRAARQFVSGVTRFFTDDTLPGGRAKDIARQIGQFEEGEAPTTKFGGKLTEEELQIFSQAFGAAETKGLEHLAPDLKRDLGFMAARAGRGDVDAVGRIGTAIQAGRDVFGAAEQLYALTGAGPTTAEQRFDLAADFLTTDMPEQRLARIQAGAGLMAQTPGMLYDTQGMAPSQAMGMAEDIYANIAGGANQQPFLERKQLQDTRRRFGLATQVDQGQYFRDQKWTPDQFNQWSQQNMLEQRGAALGQRLAGAGATTAAIQGIVGGAEMGFGEMEAAERLFNLEPISLTRQAMAGNIDNVFASMDINLQGDITGLPWGTTGLQRGGGAGEVGRRASAAGQANEIFGARWRGTDWGEAAVTGIETPSGDMVGGMRGLQWLQRYKTQEYQRTQAGIQQQQLQLGFAFQTGVGLGGYSTADPRTGEAFNIQGTGGQWGVQDRQRRLQHQQQQWGFEYQSRMFGLQGQQFEENMALQRTGQVMRRQWKQEDWGYQDLTRNMQWGWKQEDFQEQVRFMSGRERKLAERGMERETIMFNLEGEQIEKGRERQEQLWKLEDERFELTKKHFAETRALQAENMQKQKEFYEEGKRLSDQQLELTRAYYVEQYELSMQQAAAAAAYAEDMTVINNAMAELSGAQQDYQGELKLAMEKTTELIQALINGYNYMIEQADKGKIEKGYSSGDEKDIKKDEGVDPKSPGPMAIGGPAIPNMSYLVGERGTELVSDKPLSIMPNAELRALFMGGKELPDPFGTNDYVEISSQGNRDASGPTTIIVNIGNRRLGEYILDTISNELQVR